MAYEDGQYVPFTKKDHTHPDNQNTLKHEHRRFNLTLRTTQVLAVAKDCVKKGEFSEEELFELFKVVANQLNKTNSFSNIRMWDHIKLRTEKALDEKRRKYRLK